eukprot:280008-Pleurochrysis_carterae.AAC.1
MVGWALLRRQPPGVSCGGIRRRPEARSRSDAGAGAPRANRQVTRAAHALARGRLHFRLVHAGGTGGCTVPLSVRAGGSGGGRL